MDDIPMCPDFWPRILWDLHFKVPNPGPNPVNLPVDMNAILAGLAIHTASYLLPDQKEAQIIRTQTEQQLSKTILNLSKAHDESLKQRKK